jgi:CRISPR-associated protein Csm4
MNLTVIKLEFSTPLHIGRGWGELDKSEPILHSDTLKSALFAALIQLNPEWKNKAENFFNGFCISSCYPYFKDELFLPKILLNKTIKTKGVEDHKQIKTANKIEFHSWAVFEKYINTDKEIEINKNQISKNGKFVFATENEILCNFLKNDTQQRVKIENYGNSVPFFVDRMFFSEGSGLFFLANFNDEVLKKEIFSALQLLGSLGLGTDRTVGKGFFEFEEKKHVEAKDLNIEEKNCNAFATLGLYLPRKEEIETIELDKSFWNIKERGGYIAASEYLKFRHLLKTPIHMFVEGSVFYTGKKPEGRYENVKPENGMIRICMTYIVAVSQFLFL